MRTHPVQVRHCLGFSTADFGSSLAYESAEEKPKHCLTRDFLSALTIRPLREPAVLCAWIYIYMAPVQSVMRSQHRPRLDGERPVR